MARHSAWAPIFAALLSIVLLSCTEHEPEQPRDPVDEPSGQAIRLTDDAGALHELPQPPARIVSLVPAATEIIIALGEEDRLVARTDFDTTSVLHALPSVGGGLEPNIERLLSLAPALVIRFDARSDPTTPERLDRAGIPHFAVGPERIEDIRRTVRNLGTLVGRKELSEEQIRNMDRELSDVRAAVAGRPPRRVAYLLGGSPPWVAGSGTFVDEILTAAGGENVFDDLPARYAEVSLETLVSRDIEIILVVEGEPLPSGIALDRVERVSTLTRSPGLRLAEAARELARLLHPTALP